MTLLEAEQCSDELDVKGEGKGGVRGNSQVSRQLGGLTELESGGGVENRFECLGHVPCHSEQRACEVPVGLVGGGTE